MPEQKSKSDLKKDKRAAALRDNLRKRKALKQQGSDKKDKSTTKTNDT